MSISNQIVNTCQSRFNVEIAIPQSLPTQYDNDSSFQKPSSGRWASVHVIEGDTIAIESDGEKGLFRHPGTFVAQLFEDIGVGTGGLYGLVDLVVTAFRSLQDGPVVFRSPTVQRVGVEETGAWHQVNVSCPFYADEIAALG